MLRCVNVTDVATSGRWDLPFVATEARLARLDETPLGDLIPSDASVAFTAGPRAVVTILVR